MKKLYTIAAALFIGALGFNANAESYLPESIDPDPDEVLSALPNEVNLTFDGELTVNTYSEAYDSFFECLYFDVLVNDEPWMIEEYGGAEPAQVTGGVYSWAPNVLTISFGMIEDEFKNEFGSGKITVIIPEAAVLIGSDDANAPITLEYMIENNSLPEPVQYMDNDPFMPAFIVYWDEPIIINDDPEADSLEIKLYTPKNLSEPISAQLYLTTYSDESSEPGITTRAAGNNGLILSLTGMGEENGYGRYSFGIPAGVITNDEGKANDYIWCEFDIEEPIELVEVAVVDITEDAITVSWPGITSVTEYNPDGGRILLMSADYTEEYPFTLGDGVSIENGVVTISLDGIELTDGVSYELIIPEYFFYLGPDADKANALVDYYFDYSAVKALGVEGGDAVIYNLQGQKVANPGSGLYIINGKKVLIRK